MDQDAIRAGFDSALCRVANSTQQERPQKDEACIEAGSIWDGEEDGRNDRPWH